MSSTALLPPSNPVEGRAVLAAVNAAAAHRTRMTPSGVSDPSAAEVYLRLSWLHLEAGTDQLSSGGCGAGRHRRERHQDRDDVLCTGVWDQKGSIGSSLFS